MKEIILKQKAPGYKTFIDQPPDIFKATGEEIEHIVEFLEKVIYEHYAEKKNKKKSKQK